MLKFNMNTINKILLLMFLGWIYFVYWEFYRYGIEPKWIYYVLSFAFAGIIISLIPKSKTFILKKILVWIWFSLILFINVLILALYTKEYCLIIFSCFVWYILGEFILSIFIKDILPKLDKVVISMAIGMVIYSFIMMGLGLIGKLYPIYLIIVMMLIAILGIIKYFSRFSVKEWIKSLPENLSKYEQTCISQNYITILLFFIITLHFLIFITGNLAPPTLGDDIFYHLPIGKIYANNYALIPTLVNFPFCLEILCAQGYILGSEYLYSGLVNMAYNFVLLGSFYILGRKYFNHISGLMSFVFLFSIPYYNIHAYSFSVDLKFLIYIILLIYAFLAWIESKDKKWLWLAGVMTGLSLNYRYHGLIWAGFLFICSIIVMSKQKLKIQKITAKLIIFIFLIIIFGFPWYLKNYIQTGNPIFPASMGSFNGFYGDPEMSEVYRQAGDTNSPFVYGHWGFGTSFESLIKLPLRMTFVGGGFEGYYLTPIYLAFIPLLFILGFKKKRNKIIFILYFCIFYTLIWFYQMQQAKFMIPIFALLSVMIGESYMNSLNINKRLINIIFLSVIIVPNVLALKIFYPHHFKEKIPVILKIEDKNSYLNKKLSFHPMVNYMNLNLPINSNVLTPWELALFYLNRDYTIASGGHQINIDYRKMSSFEDFLTTLKRKKVTHILDTKNKFESLIYPNGLGTNNVACYIIFSKLNYKYLKKVCENNNLELLEINYPLKMDMNKSSVPMNPVIIGDVLFKVGKLDMAKQQYEKAYRLGNKEAKIKLNRINLMSHIDRGDYYLNKTKEFNHDGFLKASLNEYLLALKEIDKDISKKKIIKQKVDDVYATAMSIVPHIWGHISRVKVK